MALGHVRALDDDAVRLLQVLQKARGAATANEAPRLGTVALCQIRAWFSIWMAPIAVKSFLIR